MLKIPHLRGGSLFLWIVIAVLPVYAADPELKVPESEARKAAVVKPAPEYPMTARQLKLSGRVELEAIVAANGDVEDVRIKTGSPVLTKAAGEATRKWKFQPFLLDGKPVRAVASLSFEFTSR